MFFEMYNNWYFQLCDICTCTCTCSYKYKYIIIYVCYYRFKRDSMDLMERYQTDSADIRRRDQQQVPQPQQVIMLIY